MIIFYSCFFPQFYQVIKTEVKWKIVLIDRMRDFIAALRIKYHHRGG
jgi:hypothetical protein